MGEFNVNKSDGSLEQTAGMPSEYPANQVTYNNTVSGLTATDVQGAVDEVVYAVIPKTVKSVTANGTKTYAQLFVDLANLGAGGNALKIGSLTFSMVNQSNYFSCYFSGSNIIDILSIYMTTSTAIYKGVAINNTGAVTWVDMSNDVPPSGTKIEKVII